MIFRSSYPDIRIPDVPLTPLVLRHAHELANKPALIDGINGRTLTYRQLDDAIRRVAASLARRGLRKGDVFAIFSPNCPDYVIAFHAVSLLGGIVTTINPLNTAGEAAQQLADASAKYLLTIPSFLDKALDATRHAPVRETFIFGDAPDTRAVSFSMLFESDGRVPEVDIDPRADVVALPYSSGTTGTAKGVMLTHHNLVANLCQAEACRMIDQSDTLICVLPLFHIYGLEIIMNLGLYVGATIVTLPRFELNQFLQTLQNYSVTLAHVVPPIILALAQHPSVERYDLTKLKAIFSGAAPLGETLARACVERLGCSIRQGYGMTETSPATHTTPAETNKGKRGSVGTCVPNTECKIVDPSSGVALGYRQEGELCVRGPQLMKGYLNQPEATARTIDAEGWLHTGDVGYADEDGHFYIVDRLKELIKYKGFQVAPAELEAVLLAHTAVADAAVIPCPDDEAGEVPKAFVVLKAEATMDELMTYVAARVAPHKRIRRIEFVEQIPKSASGKILRRLLVARQRTRPT